MKLLNQYRSLKVKYPDVILLIEVNGFYETFEDDAILVSKVLGTSLIKRESYAFTGFPAYSLELYLPKLVRAGNRVGIASELELPKNKKLSSSRSPKTTISDFTFEFSGHGHYRVTYTSPATGKRWRKTISDMTLIDATKNEDCPKQKDLEQLKRIIKY